MDAMKEAIKQKIMEMHDMLSMNDDSGKELKPYESNDPHEQEMMKQYIKEIENKKQMDQKNKSGPKLNPIKVDVSHIAGSMENDEDKKLIEEDRAPIVKDKMVADSNIVSSKSRAPMSFNEKAKAYKRG